MPTAVISPRDNLAGLICPDGASVEVVPFNGDNRRTLPIPGYLARFPDSKFATVSDWIGAAEALTSARDQCTTLDFTLMLFDSELSIKLRESVATELATLISNSTNYEYALDILLAAPLPDSADVEGAQTSTALRENVARYVELIKDSQERVALACRTWYAIHSHSMVRGIDTDSLRATFIRHGVFRKFVLNATTQAETDVLVGNLIYEEGLKKECDARIIHAFASEYRAHLPPGSSGYTQPQPIVDSETEAPERRNRDSVKTSRPTATKADDLADWAVEQIQTIVDLFRTGKDHKGREFADQLIASQLIDTGMPPFSVPGL